MCAGLGLCLVAPVPVMSAGLRDPAELLYVLAPCFQFVLPRIYHMLSLNLLCMGKCVLRVCSSCLPAQRTCVPPRPMVQPHPPPQLLSRAVVTCREPIPSCSVTHPLQPPQGLCSSLQLLDGGWPSHRKLDEFGTSCLQAEWPLHGS